MNLPPWLALDRYHDALAGPRREEERALRPNVIGLPAIGDPRRSGRHQDLALIDERRQLGELEQLAAHVPNDEPRRGVDRRERIRCRASRVMGVAHGAMVVRQLACRKSNAKRCRIQSVSLAEPVRGAGREARAGA